MGMSYRRAWLLVDGMNQRFRKPLVVASQGGSGGGGANVTDFGREVLRRYNALEAKAAAAVSKEIKQFEALMVLK
jgi:molybdate transport system regulatory protein